MNTIIENIVRNARLLYQNQNTELITKTNPYLYAVSHTCITNRELMCQVPAKDSGYVGFAYLQILDLTDEPSVFQTYSTITFYFLEKAIRYGYKGEDKKDKMYIQILNDAIIDMNIGAQSICRTFAQTYNRIPSNYINFSDLNTLPNYVREVLIVEFSYFVEFEEALKLSNINIEDNYQIYQRYKTLKNFISQGYFSFAGVTNQKEAFAKGMEIRSDVYAYVARKMEKGDIVFA